MNSTQIVLVIVGVLLLFIGPMFLQSKLAQLVMFPRSLPALLVTMLFFPALMILFIIWMIVITAAETRSAGDALVAGFSALFQPIFGGMFLVIYAFCVLIGLIGYLVGRMGERSGRLFAASRGIPFSKEGGPFQVNPDLGNALLELRNVVTLSPDSFIASFTGRVPSPGTSQGGHAFLSLAVGPVGERAPSGTLFVSGQGGEDHETMEVKGLTVRAPRAHVQEWRALLLALFEVVDPRRCPFGMLTVHQAQLTLVGGQLTSQRDYTQMAALLAAAGAPRAVA